MELRLLFFSVLAVCFTLTARSANAQDPQFTETEEMIEMETTSDVESPESTEVTFPEAEDFPDVAIPEPAELPPIPTSPEFIPDESLMMDSLPPLDDFPDFDGGFEIPAFGSELDPARVIRQRIQIRRARMNLESDPAIQALKADAEATGTAYEYREKMQQYYTALYDGVSKAHPGLTEVIDAERKKFIATVTTWNIRPTERPSHLPPLPEGAIAPGIEAPIATADPADEITD